VFHKRRDCPKYGQLSQGEKNKGIMIETISRAKGGLGYHVLKSGHITLGAPAQIGAQINRSIA
jgi:hypothetical protein